MTGAEHYQRAEELLRDVEQLLARGDVLAATVSVHRAQTHAMLADIAARLDISAALKVPDPRRV